MKLLVYVVTSQFTYKVTVASQSNVPDEQWCCGHFDFICDNLSFQIIRFDWNYLLFCHCFLDPDRRPQIENWMHYWFQFLAQYLVLWWRNVQCLIFGPKVKLLADITPVVSGPKRALCCDRGDLCFLSSHHGKKFSYDLLTDSTKKSTVL